MKRQLLLLPLLLGMIVYACGEKAEPPHSDTSTGTTFNPTPSSPSAPSYDPVNEQAFAELVYKEYAYMATKTSKRRTDSIFQATKDPKKMQEAIKGMMQTQDSVARRSLARKYGIPLDSVEAIIKTVGAKKRPLQ